MSWLIFHIVSGHAFFTGVILLVIAAAASTRTQRVFARVTVLSFLLGLIAIVISSSAIPYWFYGVASLATLLWLVSWLKTGWKNWTPYLVAFAWLCAAAIELPYHLVPKLEPVGHRTMTVIGDSVSAGMGGSDTAETWPRIFSRAHNIQVQDLSHVGETAKSALKRAQSQEITGSLVLLEIGGNDILGSTTCRQFEENVAALLDHLVHQNRQIVMLELPLPPFCHEWGRIQRQLSRKYGVALVPKRVFYSVLGGGESTLDTIHLSQAGHQQMADSIWSVVGSAFDNNAISFTNAFANEQSYPL